MHVTIKNPRTGETKSLKVGWSWILFFWSSLFGLPLFVRRLHGWGVLFLILFIVNFMTQAIASTEHDDSATPFLSLLSLVSFGVSIYLGIKGNELTGKNYLDRGWIFADPLSTDTAYAQKAWKLQ